MTAIDFSLLADREDALPIIARWYVEESGYLI